ncbi:GNAT family N-acetyltransferase [Mucilaginibacter robiniae]|uniref:GNAT family N-acetyltransferase n=2 Tax=Mucilaginibacter robiniae TaxID=2728022 RepID=A0A7L5EBE6_9SPHI|nr:GNAT family N-acetyltransferase [Mucilaginibacter robiniae]
MHEPILQTSRLTLRHFMLDDASFVLQLLNSPTWLKYIGDRDIKTLQEAQSYLVNGPLLNYQLHGFGMCVVCLRTDGTPIGMCGLVKRDVLPELDLGYALLPEYEGQGYGTEIARGVLQYYQAKLGLKRLLAITIADNIASIRVLEKLGFQFEKTITLKDDSDELMLFAAHFNEKGTP